MKLKYLLVLNRYDKYYYYLMRRIHSTLKDFDIYEKDTLILIRNMMKKRHHRNIIKRDFYMSMFYAVVMV